MPTMTAPLVSIITPTYNHERYVGACIESVLRQSYGSWEQIVIDDGSTDGTAAAVKSYSDPRVRYLHQENAGIEALAHTYNRALAESRGSLIAVLEGDDTWPEHKLATMVPAFSDPLTVLAYGEMREIDPTGNVAERASRTTRKHRKQPRSVLFNDPVRAAVPYMLTVPGHSLIPASTVVIRRTALHAIGGFQYVEGQLYTDYPTFIQLALQGRFHFFSETMGFRRMHFSSATAQFSEEMLERSRKHLSELLETPEFIVGARELRHIERSWRSAAASGRFRRGRLLLLERRWSEARGRFLGAVQSADLGIAAASIVGWGLSWLHRDLEGLYRRAGRPPIRAG